MQIVIFIEPSDIYSEEITDAMSYITNFFIERNIKIINAKTLKEIEKYKTNDTLFYGFINKKLINEINDKFLNYKIIKECSICYNDKIINLESITDNSIILYNKSIYCNMINNFILNCEVDCIVYKVDKGNKFSKPKYIINRYADNISDVISIILYLSIKKSKKTLTNPKYYNSDQYDKMLLIMSEIMKVIASLQNNKTIQHYLIKWNNYLNSTIYIINNNITIADTMMFELLKIIDHSKYVNLVNYVKKFD